MGCAWRAAYYSAGALPPRRCRTKRTTGLMRTMRPRKLAPLRTAVHAYEDCSLLVIRGSKAPRQGLHLQPAHRLLPGVGEKTAGVGREYADWLPSEGLFVQSLCATSTEDSGDELADLVLVPLQICAIRPSRSTLRKRWRSHHSALIGVFGIRLQSHGTIARAFHLRRPMRVAQGNAVLLEAWRRAALVTRHSTWGGLAAFRGKKGEPSARVSWHGPVLCCGTTRPLISARMCSYSRRSLKVSGWLFWRPWLCGLPVHHHRGHCWSGCALRRMRQDCPSLGSSTRWLTYCVGFQNIGSSWAR